MEYGRLGQCTVYLLHVSRLGYVVGFDEVQRSGNWNLKAFKCWSFVDGTVRLNAKRHPSCWDSLGQRSNTIATMTDLWMALPGVNIRGLSCEGAM